MAQPGVDIQLNFAQDITRATAQIAATPAQLEKAVQRAIKKTMRWLQTRIAREVATALGVPQKAIKHRLSVTQTGKGTNGIHILWLGTAPLAAESAGKPRQTKAGVTVGKRKFPGAFYRDVYGDGPKVWIRASRANALGMDLPQWGRKQRARASTLAPGEGGRFPVRRVSIDVQHVANDIFGRYQKQAEQRFNTVIDQELNYAVNHESKR